MVTNRHIAHYRVLANGGPGLATQEATSVGRAGRLAPDQLGIWEDAQVPGLQNIARELHRAGQPAIMQLSYAGIDNNTLFISHRCDHCVCLDNHAEKLWDRAIHLLFAKIQGRARSHHPANVTANTSKHPEGLRGAFSV